MPEQRKPANSEPPKKRRKWAAPTEKPRTPKATEQRVFALALAGRKKSHIAREVGINRETIARILSQQEFDSIIDQIRSRIVTELGEEALKALKYLIRKRDRMAVMQTLFGLKVLSQHSELKLQGGEQGERTYAYASFEFYQKYGRWPTLQEAKEFDKTLEVQLIEKDRTN